MATVVDDGGGSSRSLVSEKSWEEETTRVSVDLVAAARWNLKFLRIVAEEGSHWLHHTPTIIQAIRRYDELWMPLVSELSVGSDAPVILPPLDIEWVWYCHTLNPVSYRQYCESKFSKLIGKPAFFNKANEEYALDRCRDIWVQKYPLEPFENELACVETSPCAKYEDLLSQVLRQRNLYAKLAEPYMSETVYVIAARKRYKKFLYLLQRFAHGCARLVPAADILLMWMSHQAYPTAYAADVKEIEGVLGKVVAVWEEPEEEEVEETKKLWERVFEKPYLKAGGTIIQRAFKIKGPLHWEVTYDDVNTRYKSMLPRFLLEVCVFVKLDSKTHMAHVKKSLEFLRLRLVRCHKELKIDKPISTFPLDTWHKAWHLYCEFRTKGLMIEIRKRGGLFFQGSALEGTMTFLWNDMLRETSLTVEREVNQTVRVVSYITPPAQASYLLKCVPDRVTDDSGTMISDVILRMNQYRPQEGRWLSRTVLDHAGRECFVVRMRVAGGFWRRGVEAPSAVKWEDRIVEIREGSWSYIAGAIGRAPVKVVGTATPQEPKDQWDVSWKFSCGYKLTIRWESLSSMSTSNPCFHLMNETCPKTNAKLVKGRKMQYRRLSSILNKGNEHETTNENKLLEDDEEEEGFITLIQLSEENPTGKATALLNWKQLVVEFLPEEDAAFLLLLCVTILRSVSEMRKKDTGGLLIRRRLKEPKLGARDWGSVTLHPSSCSPSILSPNLQPWYWNPRAVIVSDDSTGQQVVNHSQAEGGDALFKRVIFS